MFTCAKEGTIVLALPGVRCESKAVITMIPIRMAVPAWKAIQRDLRCSKANTCIKQLPCHHHLGILAIFKIVQGIMHRLLVNDPHAIMLCVMTAFLGHGQYPAWNHCAGTAEGPASPMKPSLPLLTILTSKKVQATVCRYGMICPDACCLSILEAWSCPQAHG